MTKWKIDEALDLPLAVIEDTEDGYGVAEIGKRTSDNIANANLIAAAPELLEALKAVNKRVRCNMMHELQTQVDNAINKAGGVVADKEVDKDSIHLVRFTKNQVAFLRHLFNETGFDYFEEECLDLVDTIKKAEKDSI